VYPGLLPPERHWLLEILRPDPPAVGRDLQSRCTIHRELPDLLRKEPAQPVPRVTFGGDAVGDESGLGFRV